MTPTQERRYQPRVACSKEVWIGQDGIFSRISDRIANISTGGVFIETAQRFAIGSILDLRFPVGDSPDPICCAAIIRNWRGGTGLGLEFLDLSAESRARIAAYLTNAGNSPTT